MTTRPTRAKANQNDDEPPEKATTPVVDDASPAAAGYDAASLPEGERIEVPVDPSYIERPYSEAATDEQKAALKAAGLPLR